MLPLQACDASVGKSGAEVRLISRQFEQNDSRNRRAQRLKGKIATLVFRIVFAIMAVYAYFGGECPAKGCPACKLIGK